MRLGLIGLGRIGAFHAGNLTTLPTVDSLVVTDIVDGLPQRIAEACSLSRKQHRPVRMDEVRP